MSTRASVFGVPRSAILAVAALLSAALIVTGITPAAHAAPDDAELTVRVLTPAGVPIATAAVTAISLDDSDYGEHVQAAPAAGGRYTFPSLDSERDYAIRVDTNIGNANANFRQFYGGATALADARPFRPEAGTSTLEFSLLAGSYSGKVLTPKGVGLAGVDVHLFKHDGATWSLVETVRSAAKTGAYAFPYLEPGSYTAEYDTSLLQPNYIGVFAGGAAVTERSSVRDSVGRAAVAQLVPGKPTVVNQKLVIGASVSAIVRDGIVPMSNVTVTPLLTSGSGATRTQVPLPMRSVRTSASGKFVISGLPSGVYAFRLGDESTSGTYTLTAGKTRAGLILQRSSAATRYTVSGSVTPAPVDGTVEIGRSADFATTARSVDIAADGSFQLSLEPGSYEYRAVVADAKPAYGFFEVADAAMALPITTEPEEGLDFASAPSVTSTGGTAVGAVFTVAAASNHPTSSIVTYRWMSDGIPIFGATSATYRARGGDVGSVLSVRVGVVERHFEAHMQRTITVGTVSAGDPVANTSPPTIVAPAITRPGSVLRAAPGTWSESPVAVAYRWLSNGVLVTTASTFTVRPADAMKTITLEATASRIGHESSGPIVSAPVVVAPLAAPIAKVAPKVTSTAKGQPAGSVRYTVSGGTWSPTAKPGYVWTADGDPISTSSTLVWNAATYGTKAIVVTVTAKREGYADAVRRIVVRASTATPVQTSASEISVVGESDDNGIFSGATITATSGTWSHPEGVAPTFTYTWSRGNSQVRIPGATKASYTVTDADFSLPLYVSVTASAPGYKTVTSDPVHAGDGWAKSDLTGAQAVVSFADPVPLVPVTAVVSDENGVLAGLEPLTYRYQWFTCRSEVVACDVDEPQTYIAIPKAVGRTFTPPTSMAGAHLAVRVWVSKPGQATVNGLSSAGGIVGPLTEAVASVPKITNSGLSSTIAKPVFVPNDAVGAATYRWYVGDSEVVRSESRVFARTVADAGKPVTVRVTYESGNELYSGGTFERDYLAVRGVIATPAPKPIVGSRLGDTLQAPVYALEYPHTPGATSVAYQWYLNGVAIKNATLATYRPTSATLIGKKLTVRVTSASQRYASVVVMSPAVKLAAGLNPAGVPTIDVPGGTVKPGVVLSANTSSFTVTGQTFAYQWRLYTGTSWVNIAKATAKTYRVLPTQVGKDLRVVVTGKRAGFSSRTAVSDAATVQGSGDLPVIVAPVLVGSGQAGTTLGIAAGTYGTTGVTASYRWLRNGTIIPGAVASSFALPGSQFGDTISAEVTLKAVGFTPWTAVVGERVVSAGSAPVATGASLPKITGTATTCGTLTASSGIWSRDGAAFTYRWFTPQGVVEGATSSTFTIPQDGAGVTYRVEVTATAEGYAPGIALSASSAKATSGSCP